MFAAPPLEDEAATWTLQKEVKQNRYRNYDRELPKSSLNVFARTEHRLCPVIEEEVNEIKSETSLSEENQNWIGQKTGEPIVFTQPENDQCEAGDE